MLSLIRIRNYAVIDELELEFGSGLSVLTGETGAGKSILVDALGLALGDRADANTVRKGKERAEICVTFDCPDSNVTCVKRNISNTPIAALATLNNSVFTDAAKAMAKRLIKEQNSDVQRITMGFQLLSLIHI